MDGTALPISGWRLRQRLQRNGRVAIEIADDTGDLVGLITSTNLPMLSVDGAWRGRASLVDGTRRWWALAIGHATASDDDHGRDLLAVQIDRVIEARGKHRRRSTVVLRGAEHDDRLRRTSTISA